MSTTIVLHGKARDAPDGAAWYGSAVPPGKIQTRFRVDDQAILFAGAPALVDGDRVTVAGYAIGREFRAFALRDHSTGAEYLAPVGWSGAVFLMLAGLVQCAAGVAIGAGDGPKILLALPLIFAGLTCCLFGVVQFVASRRNRRANEALLATYASRPSKAMALVPSSPAPAGRNLVSAIVSGIQGSLGASFIAVALLISAAVITDGTFSPVGRTLSLIVSGLFGLCGLLLVRSVLRDGLPRAAIQTEPFSVLPEHLGSVRRQLLAVASNFGGRLTASEVANAAIVEVAAARRVLDEAVEAGEARLLFSPEAVPVYEFQELVASKAEAKELWELD